MGRFQLIALDMDGTLLDSWKNLPPDCISAIREVTDAGKTVVFATGRAVSEILEFEPLLPEVRYAIFSSGAGIYDLAIVAKWWDKLVLSHGFRYNTP